MKPFVIIACPRTGSTLVAQTLNQHPHIKCGREVLHSPLNISEWRPPVIQKLYGHQDSPLNFKKLDPIPLVQYAFTIFDGFKIMCGQTKTNDPLWQYLKEFDCRFIFIQRNMIDSIISLYHAETTGIWHLYKKIEVPQQKIVIPVEFCMKYVDFYNQYLDLKHFLGSRPHFILEYFKIKESWQELQEFLGVNYHELQSPTHKILNQRPVITNLEEVLNCVTQQISFL